MRGAQAAATNCWVICDLWASGRPGLAWAGVAANSSGGPTAPQHQDWILGRAPLSASAVHYGKLGGARHEFILGAKTSSFVVVLALQVKFKRESNICEH